MIVYEVNLEVDLAIVEAYRAWLDAHVQEILALPGFDGVRVYDVLDPLPTAGRTGLSVQYLLRDAGTLEDYLREQAPRLRAEGLERFGDGVRIRRRVLGKTTLR